VPSLVDVLVPFMRRRDSALLEAATADAQMPIEELAHRLSATAAHVALLRESILGAREAVLEEKVAFLGRCLANGASGDDAVVSTETFFAAAIRDLEAPHLRVLSLIKANPTMPERALMYDPHNIGPPLVPIMATLTRHGLIQEWEQDPSRRDRLGVSLLHRSWSLSAFGSQVIARIEEAGYR
jgi:hypothetical protein